MCVHVSVYVYAYNMHVMHIICMYVSMYICIYVCMIYYLFIPRTMCEELKKKKLKQSRSRSWCI